MKYVIQVIKKILVDAGVHSEHVQVIRRVIKLESVARSIDLWI
jgi:hypothetical protein